MVLMRFYQDMKVQDIAEELGVSRNTVRNTLNQALATLRRKLGMLPVGVPLPALLTEAVEHRMAPGALPRSRRGASWLDWGTRAVAAVTAAAAVGMLGSSATGRDTASGGRVVRGRRRCRDACGGHRPRDARRR